MQTLWSLGLSWLILPLCGCSQQVCFSFSRRKLISLHSCWVPDSSLNPMSFCPEFVTSALSNSGWTTPCWTRLVYLHRRKVWGIFNGQRNLGLWCVSFASLWIGWSFLIKDDSCCWDPDIEASQYPCPRAALQALVTSNLLNFPFHLSQSSQVTFLLNFSKAVMKPAGCKKVGRKPHTLSVAGVNAPLSHFYLMPLPFCFLASGTVIFPLGITCHFER